MLLGAEHVFKDLYQRILWLYSFCMYLGQPSPCHSHGPHMKGGVVGDYEMD